MTFTRGMMSYAVVLTFSFGAIAQNAREILHRSAEAYVTPLTYDFSGTLQTEFEFNETKYRLRMLLEMARGSTPDQSLAYQLKNYNYEAPTGPNVKYPFLTPSFPYDFAQFGINIASVRLLPEESIEVNGKSASCYVLEVARAPKVVHTTKDAKSEAPSDRGREYLWIDKNSYLVLRIRYEQLQAATASQVALKMSTVAEFNSYVLNGEPPQWLVSAKAGFEKRIADLRLSMVGKLSPDSKLYDLSGSQTTIAALRGKVVLLDFWSTWCAPCRSEIPVISKIERDWEKNGLAVVRVTDESPDEVRRFLKSTGASYRTFVDSGDLFRAYRVEGLPATIIIDRSGTISSYDEAILSEAQLVERLRKAGIDSPLSKLP